MSADPEIMRAAHHNLLDIDSIVFLVGLQLSASWHSLARIFLARSFLCNNATLLVRHLLFELHWGEGF
jgi:hypothetical protein